MKTLVAAFSSILLAGGCGTTSVLPPELPASTSSATASRVPRHVRVRVVERGTTVVREVPLEEYVQAAALSEFAPPTGDPATVERMLEVQAIISRTYAVAHIARHGRDGFDLCSTTHCQLYEPGRLRTSRWANAAADAVARTAGMVLSFGGQPVQALFHADCGGHTSAAASVWGGVNRPYLVSRADDGVPAEAHVRWEYRITLDEMSAALAADPRTRGTGRLVGLDIVARDAAGRAERVAIHRQLPKTPARRSTAGPVAELRGEDLREVLARTFGARSIRSTWFEISRDRSDVLFTGRGFGHGVGLCQAGALARLRAGISVGDVIRYYYPGSRLQTGAFAQRLLLPDPRDAGL